MVSYGDLGNQLALFPQWFPNMLKLKEVHVDDCRIKIPFQHLLHLDIDVNNGTLCYGFTEKNKLHV